MKNNEFYEIANKKLKESCQFIYFDENNKEEWLRLRMSGIGGSDVGPILGHSQWRDRKDIYLSKKELQPQVHSFAIDFGNDFEDIMFQIFAKKYKNQYAVLNYKNVMFRNVWYPMLQASLDGVLVDKYTKQVGIIEIKTVQESKKKWYDQNGNRIVPLTYLDQAVHYFNVTNVDFVVFFVAINYEKSKYDKALEILQPRIYYRCNLLKYCQETLENCLHFWNHYVIKDIIPTELFKF